MRNTFLVVVLTILASPPSVHAEELRRYVAVDRLNVRLSPDVDGKITNALNRGQSISVFEVKDGWARISKYYNGQAEGVSGDVARWVYNKHLVSEKQEQQVTSNSGGPLQEAMQGSDDYGIYKDAFESASTQLVADGTCSVRNFAEMGGWLRSSSFKPRPVYFTYCGEMVESNRIYLDVDSGEVFK